MRDLHGNLAIRERLLGERDNSDAIEFSDELLTGEIAPETKSLMAYQSALFASRRDARRQKKQIWQEQIGQYEQVIVGITAQIDSQTKQLALIREESSGVAQLVAKGLERKPRLLALQRSEAEIIGGRANNQATLAKTRQAIMETRAQILGIDTEHMQEVGQKLAETEAAIFAVREKLGAARHVVDRTVLVAPVSGTVVSLKANTIGGVVRAGDTILEIVPRDEELLVDARISPNDIDSVRPDLEARVIMTGYPQRSMPQLVGRVRQVSADRLVDSRTGQPYYLARIELPADHVREVAPFLSLKPGMPAEIMVITGERTVLDYLAEPLLASVRKSFREN
jgi:HlyD family secretion protein/epimerase transport system membrane fusion protein